MTNSFMFGTVGKPIKTPKYPGGSIGAIIFSQSIGLQTLELGWVRSVRVSEETCAKINNTAQEQNVLLSVHAPYYINLNADEDEWVKSRKRLMDAAYYGYLAGATDIVFHPGSYFGEPPEKVLVKAISRLKHCVEELKSRQVTVTLRPETMGKSAMLGSLHDTLLMSQEIEGVEPCLDLAHLYARTGDGSVNSKLAWEEQLDQYGSHLGENALQRLHIHLSGIEYTQKGEKKHLPISESGLGVEAILIALKNFNCRGRILCESPIMEEDAINLKLMWQEISGESYDLPTIP